MGWAEVADDPKIWAEIRDLLRDDMVEAFGVIYQSGRLAMRASLHGVKALNANIWEGANLNLDAASRAAMEDYFDSFYEQIGETRRRAIIDAVRRSRDEGLTRAQIEELLRPHFGPERARGIAVTETTRLLGRGAQAEMKSLGYDSWIWNTAQDRRVCPICEGKAGTEFPMTQDFDPSHPGCRCWPTPGRMTPAAAGPFEWDPQELAAIHDHEAHFSWGGDARMAEMAARNGFSGQPTLMSNPAYQAYLKEHDGLMPLHRGVQDGDVTARTIIRNFRNGAYEPGNGMYGNGFYFDNDRNVAMSYADQNGRNIMSGTLRHDAKVITALTGEGGDRLHAEMRAADKAMDKRIAALKDEMEKLPAGERKAFEEREIEPLRKTQALVMSDDGRYAVYAGYDAIITSTGFTTVNGRRVEQFYVVVLNRKAVVMRE